ncbi:hypothetical protein AVEN_201518-1 [Araneus ventricosus]|uniref:Uncharacterized protein n=1 Tax=Araneus ventricosus TaxID=182803 RepID=A0A4Y2Q7M3_ARAVE|nr:hypothetical protein AVEN_201518-1 [Araneus ventricosus]
MTLYIDQEEAFDSLICLAVFKSTTMLYTGHFFKRRVSLRVHARYKILSLCRILSKLVRSFQLNPELGFEMSRQNFRLKENDTLALVVWIATTNGSADDPFWHCGSFYLKPLPIHAVKGDFIENGREWRLHPWMKIFGTYTIETDGNGVVRRVHGKLSS